MRKKYQKGMGCDRVPRVSSYGLDSHVPILVPRNWGTSRDVPRFIPPKYHRSRSKDPRPRVNPRFTLNSAEPLSGVFAANDRINQILIEPIFDSAAWFTSDCSFRIIHFELFTSDDSITSARR